MKEVRASKSSKDTKKRSKNFGQQLSELDAQYDQQRRQDQTELKQQQRDETELDQQGQFEAQFDKQMKALEKKVEQGHAEALRLVQSNISNFEETFNKYIDAELEKNFDEDGSDV
jgi:hypothetical protein